MKHILVEMMASLTKLTKEEELAISNSFPIKKFNKGLIYETGMGIKTAWVTILPSNFSEVLKIFRCS